MKNKRYTLRINFVGSLKWDIIEDYSRFEDCKKEAKELKDETVKYMVIEDKAKNELIVV
ncbi:hypothetical protein Phi12:1_gp14 [Cellulophaga phage phi12:1]|uniref:Uncharacterized protein n=2 Tax=Cellulophaga phage phi12:1 TaxID=1327976 RepID=R9ZZL6_9CAUD|nr:hypothetical protein Phi12:1_gp14 [Cellulophaga phage phi12:1]AGO47980.1 hypothetical protein Phi12:1_gp14 [Cellulophaga phage phi12:1]AGO48145.1 hypothetical protein Phi12:3_gp14 [Cellulophaga phage phi12:3]